MWLFCCARQGVLALDAFVFIRGILTDVEHKQHVTLSGEPEWSPPHLHYPLLVAHSRAIASPAGSWGAVTVANNLSYFGSSCRRKRVLVGRA
jgi:hypothetical protein